MLIDAIEELSGRNQGNDIKIMRQGRVDARKSTARHARMMEETDVPAVCNQIVRTMAERNAASLPALYSLAGGVEKTCGYYCVMQRMRQRQRRRADDVGTLRLFGPFDNCDVARFIGISARALGLIEPDTAIPPAALRQPSASRQAASKVRRRAYPNPIVAPHLERVEQAA